MSHIQEGLGIRIEDIAAKPLLLILVPERARKGISRRAPATYVGFMEERNKELGWPFDIAVLDAEQISDPSILTEMTAWLEKTGGVIFNRIPSSRLPQEIKDLLDARGINSWRFENVPNQMADVLESISGNPELKEYISETQYHIPHEYLLPKIQEALELSNIVLVINEEDVLSEPLEISSDMPQGDIADIVSQLDKKYTYMVKWKIEPLRTIGGKPFIIDAIVQKNHLGQFQVAQRLVRIPKKKFEGRVHVGVTPGYTGRQTLLEELWMDGTIDEELVISMDSMLIKLGRHLDNHFGPVGNFGCKLLIGQDQKIYITFITDMPFQAPVGITPIIQERVEQTMRITDQALWRYVSLINRASSKESLRQVDLRDVSQDSESSSPLNELFQPLAHIREVLRRVQEAKKIFLRVHQAMLPGVWDEQKEFYLPGEAKFFTKTLARHGLIWQGAQVLDMGCGLGPLSTFAAIMKADVLAIDIQGRYIKRTKEIAEELGVSRRVTCVQSNLFEALKISGLPRKEQFDLIVFFPPIFDEGDEGDEKPEVLDPGFRIISRFVQDAPTFLKRQGVIAILYPCYRNYRYLLAKLAAENKLSIQIMARKFRCSFIAEGDGFGGGDIGFARMWAVYALRPLPVERVKVPENKVALGRLGLASSSPLGAFGQNKGFVCDHCGHKTKPLPSGFRNHCPNCLYSNHLDNEPGDRRVSCKGLMEPIGVEYYAKKGWVIIFQCVSCGSIKRNKAATDDSLEQIIVLQQLAPAKSVYQAYSSSPLKLKGVHFNEELGLSEELKSLIIGNASWEVAPKVLKPGRSAHITLMKPLRYAGIPHKVISAPILKLKGIANFDGNRTTPPQPANYEEPLPTYYLDCNPQGEIFPKFGRRKFLGAQSADLARREFEIHMEALKKGAPVNISVAYGVYEDGRFPEEIGFVVLGIRDSQDRRFEDLLHAEFIEEIGALHFNDYLFGLLGVPAGKRSYQEDMLRFFASVFKSRGKALRLFHDAGFVKFEGHDGNFQLDEQTSEVLMTDLDICLRKSEIDVQEIFLRQLFDISSCIKAIHSDIYATPIRYIYAQDGQGRNPYFSFLNGYLYDYEFKEIRNIIAPVANQLYQRSRADSQRGADIASFNASRLLTGEILGMSLCFEVAAMILGKQGIRPPYGREQLDVELMAFKQRVFELSRQSQQNVLSKALGILRTKIFGKGNDLSSSPLNNERDGSENEAKVSLLRGHFTNEFRTVPKGVAALVANSLLAAAVYVFAKPVMQGMGQSAFASLQFAFSLAIVAAAALSIYYLLSGKFGALARNTPGSKELKWMALVGVFGQFMAASCIYTSIKLGTSFMAVLFYSPFIPIIVALLKHRFNMPKAVAGGIALGAAGIALSIIAGKGSSEIISLGISGFAGIAAALLGACAFATSIIIQQKYLRKADVSAVMCISALSALVLFGTVAFLLQLLPVFNWQITLLGLGRVAFLLCVIYGTKQLPAGLTGVLVGTVPMSTLLIEWPSLSPVPWLLEGVALSSLLISVWLLSPKNGNDDDSTPGKNRDSADTSAHNTVSSPLQVIPTKVFMQDWRLLSKDEQKVAAKKIRHLYQRWQQSNRIVRPLAYFPGVNAGHIHITKADSLFYSVNTDLDTLFLMAIDSHSNSTGLFYNSDIVVLRRFLEQFKGPDVDRRILDEAGFREIGRVKIEGILTLQKALETRAVPEPENEHNDTGDDEFDLNRIWVGRQIRTAKELAEKESADFVDVLWNEYGDAERRDAMCEWVLGAVMPHVRLQWQELFTEETVTSEIKSIVDTAYAQKAAQATKIQKSSSSQGRSGFAKDVIVDDTLTKQQRRLVRLEEETSAGLARALNWQIMDSQEEQAIRLRLEVWHITGGNLDTFYTTGDSRSYKCASQEIRAILSCVTEKVGRIATLQERTRRELSETLEAADKRLHDLAPFAVALEAGQGHIAVCRTNIQELTAIQEHEAFVTAEAGIKEALDALNVLNNLLAEVSDIQSQWSGLNLGSFQESPGYAQIIATLCGISADVPLGEAVKRAVVCLEPIRQIIGQTKSQLEAVKRQNLLEGLGFYVQETQNLARNILSELHSIAPADVKALDAMIDDFDLVLLPFMRNEMKDIMLQEDIKRSGRAFDFKESAASTRQHVKRGYSGYRTWAGQLRQAIHGMPQRAIQEIESILGTTEEMIAGLCNRLESPGELAETELLKQIEAFRQNNLKIGKAYAMGVMALCCVRFHIREEILVETKAILEDIAQWKLGDRAGILKHHDRPADIDAERLMEILDSDQQKKHDAIREVLGDEMLARYREAEFTPNDIMEGENLFNTFLAQNRIFSLPRDSMVFMAGRELAFFWQWAALLIEAQPATLVCFGDFRKALAEPYPQGLQYEELLAYLRFRVEFLLENAMLRPVSPLPFVCAQRRLLEEKGIDAVEDILMLLVGEETYQLNKNLLLRVLARFYEEYQRHFGESEAQALSFVFDGGVYFLKDVLGNTDESESLAIAGKVDQEEYGEPEFIKIVHEEEIDAIDTENLYPLLEELFLPDKVNLVTAAFVLRKTNLKDYEAEALHLLMNYYPNLSLHFFTADADFNEPSYQWRAKGAYLFLEGIADASRIKLTVMDPSANASVAELIQEDIRQNPGKEYFVIGDIETLASFDPALFKGHTIRRFLDDDIEGAGILWAMSTHEKLFEPHDTATRRFLLEKKIMMPGTERIVSSGFVILTYNDQLLPGVLGPYLYKEHTRFFHVVDQLTEVLYQKLELQGNVEKPGVSSPLYLIQIHSNPDKTKPLEAVFHFREVIKVPLADTIDTRWLLAKFDSSQGNRFVLIGGNVIVCLREAFEDILAAFTRALASGWQGNCEIHLVFFNEAGKKPLNTQELIWGLIVNSPFKNFISEIYHSNEAQVHIPEMSYRPILENNKLLYAVYVDNKEFDSNCSYKDAQARVYFWFDIGTMVTSGHFKHDLVKQDNLDENSSSPLKNEDEFFDAANAVWPFADEVFGAKGKKFIRSLMVLRRFRAEGFSFIRLCQKIQALLIYGSAAKEIVRQAVYNGVIGMVSSMFQEHHSGYGQVLGIAGEISGLYEIIVKKGTTLEKISLGKLRRVNELVRDDSHGNGVVKEFDAVSSNTVFEFKFHLTLQKLYQQVIGIHAFQMPHLKVLLDYPEFAVVRNLVYFGEIDEGNVIKALNDFIRIHPEIVPRTTVTEKGGVSVKLSLSEIKEFLGSETTIALAREEEQRCKARFIPADFQHSMRYMQKLIDDKVRQLKGEKFDVIIAVSNTVPEQLRELKRIIRDNCRSASSPIREDEVGKRDGLVSTEVDLHIHSAYNGGDLTPQEIVAIAQKKGLRAIAITDHNIFSGALAALEAAKRLTIEVIPGIELRTDDSGITRDMLVYFPHQEAFLRDIKVLQEQMPQPSTEAKKRLPEAIISWAHMFGGVVVYAHPGKLKGEIVDAQAIERLFSMGIDGIEADHRLFRTSHRQWLLEILDRWNAAHLENQKIFTIGSDYRRPSYKGHQSELGNGWIKRAQHPNARHWTYEEIVLPLKQKAELYQSSSPVRQTQGPVVESYTLKSKAEFRYRDSDLISLFGGLHDAKTLIELGPSNNLLPFRAAREGGFTGNYIAVDVSDTLSRFSDSGFKLLVHDIFDIDFIKKVVKRSKPPVVIISYDVIRYLNPDGARVACDLAAERQRARRLADVFAAYPAEQLHILPVNRSVSTEEIHKIPGLMRQRNRQVIRLMVEGGYYGYDAFWAFFRPDAALPLSLARYLEELQHDSRCEILKEKGQFAASSPIDSDERSWFRANSDRAALLNSDNPDRIIRRFTPEIVIIGAGELGPFVERLLNNRKRFSIVTSPQVIKQMKQWSFPGLDRMLKQHIEVGPVHYRYVQGHYQMIKAQEPELIIGIGMGSVTDWAKLLGHKLDKEVVIIPSAVSTNAMFTANIAIRDGEKDSFEVGGALTGAVLEVVVDSDFARLNPRGNIAGAGDLLSSIVALSDWRLAIKFGRESEKEKRSRDYVYSSTETLIDELIYFSRQIKENSNEGIEKSARLACRVSEFMDIVHSGRPKAGSEHILSDTLEKEAQERKILHGEQVALATILMSYFHGLDYKNILENASHLGLPVVPEEIGLTRQNLIAGLVKAKARAARFSWFDKYKISPLDAERAVAEIFGASSPIEDRALDPLEYIHHLAEKYPDGRISDREDSNLFTDRCMDDDRVYALWVMIGLRQVLSAGEDTNIDEWLSGFAQGYVMISEFPGGETIRHIYDLREAVDNSGNRYIVSRALNLFISFVPLVQLEPLPFDWQDKFILKPSKFDPEKPVEMEDLFRRSGEGRNAVIDGISYTEEERIVDQYIKRIRPDADTEDLQSDPYIYQIPSYEKWQ
ncbi:MAG: iron-containing alcohol dehydrogenase, partial [Candidatus Omnitrophica bacterium]|nr:iron-containing alcohol dehydrogenase [Candidatus Omnitrophota bacterium]